MDEERRALISVSSDYHWSSIPGDILFSISQKLDSINDYVRLCLVCRSWYRFLANDFYDTFRHKPLCMSRPSPSSNLITLQNQTSKLVRSFPETRFWGSPFGWLVTHGPQCTLFNPVTGTTIPLPSLPEDYSGPVIKAFLTANPATDPENCLVFLQLEFEKLAFVRPAAGEFWSHIESRLHLCDITPSKGSLYGLKYFSNHNVTRVHLFRFSHGRRFVPLVDINLNIVPHNQSLHACDAHLVDFNRELCLCVQYYHRSSYFRTSFKLYRIDLETGELTRVLSLGEQCLFLGDTYSFSCKTTRCPLTDLFDKTRNAQCEIVSNYVFCSYNRRLTDLSSPCCEVEVWDMLNSRMVYSTSLFEPHWILPSINFQKLEADALKSIPTPTPTPTPTLTPTRERLCRELALGVGKSALLLFALSLILNNVVNVGHGGRRDGTIPQRYNHNMACMTKERCGGGLRWAEWWRWRRHRVRVAKINMAEVAEPMRKWWSHVGGGGATSRTPQFHFVLPTPRSLSLNF